MLHLILKLDNDDYEKKEEEGEGEGGRVGGDKGGGSYVTYEVLINNSKIRI